MKFNNLLLTALLLSNSCVNNRNSNIVISDSTQVSSEGNLLQK